MKKQRAKTAAWIGVFAITGLLVPMADGCHKHAKVKRAQSDVIQLACTTIPNTEAFTMTHHAKPRQDLPAAFREEQ